MQFAVRRETFPRQQDSPVVRDRLCVRVQSESSILVANRNGACKALFTPAKVAPVFPRFFDAENDGLWQ